MVPVLRGCDGGARRRSGNGAAAGAGRFLFAGLHDGCGSGDRCGGIAPTWGQFISTGVSDRCMRSGMVVVEERLITWPVGALGIVGATDNPVFRRSCYVPPTGLTSSDGTRRRRNCHATEELFVITIEDDEAAAVATVEAFYNLVCRKLNVTPLQSPVTSEKLPTITHKEKKFLFLSTHTPLPAPPEVLPWSPQSVWDALVAVFVDQRGLKREEILCSARIVEDLGVD